MKSILDRLELVKQDCLFRRISRVIAEKLAIEVERTHHAIAANSLQLRIRYCDRGYPTVPSAPYGSRSISEAGARRISRLAVGVPSHTSHVVKAPVSSSLEGQYGLGYSHTVGHSSTPTHPGWLPTPIWARRSANGSYTNRDWSRSL